MLTMPVLALLALAYLIAGPGASVDTADQMAPYLGGLIATCGPPPLKIGPANASLTMPLAPTSLNSLVK
jgi:hypothetical protein